MPGIIVEPDRNDQREHSYTIQVTKTRRFITCNTKHTHVTPTSVEQYLSEKIRKAAIQVEGTQAVPAEADGPPRQWVQD